MLRRFGEKGETNSRLCHHANFSCQSQLCITLAGAEAELNRVLRTQRILAVDRRWVDNGEHSYWSVCVEYTEVVGPTPSGATSATAAGKTKIDYRERLKPEDFAVFAQLRELRKEVAAKDWP